MYSGFNEESLEIFKGMQLSSVALNFLRKSAMIDTYVKFGHIHKTHILFDKI